MKEKDLELEDWDPDFDDGEPSVWAAEWDGPEEPLEPEELEKEFLMMTYRGNDVFRWHWAEIKECVDTGSVSAFLEKYSINDCVSDDEKELLEFFRHWVWFISMDSKNKPANVFEADSAIEEIGDDMLTEMDGEYAKLGKESQLTEAIKRTLH